MPPTGGIDYTEKVFSAQGNGFTAKYGGKTDIPCSAEQYSVVDGQQTVFADITEGAEINRK